MQSLKTNWRIWMQIDQNRVFCRTVNPAGNSKNVTMDGMEEPLLNAIRNITSGNSRENLPQFDLCINSSGETDVKSRNEVKQILITTHGFAELVSNLYAGDEQLDIRNNHGYDQLIEANEYIDPTGNRVTPLSESEINRILRLVFQSKKTTISIVLANSYKNPVHEKILMNLLLTAGYKDIGASYLTIQDNNLFVSQYNF